MYSFIFYIFNSMGAVSSSEFAALLVPSLLQN